MPISPPTHWTPSTQGMLDMTLAGLGWSMAPFMLASPLNAGGRLVEPPPYKRIGVSIYWQRTRLAAQLLDRLTQPVPGVAVAAVKPDVKEAGRPKTD